MLLAVTLWSCPAPAQSSPRFLDGPFDKAALDHRLEECADGSHSIGRRQRRATVNFLRPPFRAAYVTDVFCGDETDLFLVIQVGKAAFVERVASYQHAEKGASLRDPFRSLLLRGEPARPQIWLTLAQDYCQRTLWIAVGPSGKPSLHESQRDCGRRELIPAPPDLQFP